MISITLIRIFLFGLIPVGIWGLIKSIKLLAKIFNGKVILEMSFTQINGQFTIETAGSYAIWIKGRVFTRTPMNQIKPEISNTQTGDKISLIRSFMRPSSRDRSIDRMELFIFDATEGDYNLSLTEGSSLFRIESIIDKLIPSTPVDLSKHSIQIRKSKSVGFLFLGIVLSILFFSCILMGFVFGLLADQIFK